MNMGGKKIIEIESSAGEKGVDVPTKDRIKQHTALESSSPVFGFSIYLRKEVRV